MYGLGPHLLGYGPRGEGHTRGAWPVAGEAGARPTTGRKNRRRAATSSSCHMSSDQPPQETLPFLFPGGSA
uniref:Uncharacterized protein n=1 Tax=Oryza glumipatula TaxID=40148 RepID=A0A0E0BCP1_9ORYZ